MINSTVQKVLLTILLSRTQEHYEAALHASQWGFRKSRGTNDGIFVARQITTKIKSPIWGCFIDLRAAYDHLHRGTLWDIIQLRMRSSKVVDILESMYKGTQAKLDGVDAPIPVDIGVRQGGPESCVCFNYFLDVVIRIALSKIEAKFPGAGIQHDYNINLECTDRSQRFENAATGTATRTIIMYADDILLLGRSRDEIEGMMANILDTFTAFGLTLADDKTVTMTWNTPIETQEQQSLIKLGTTDLENVNQFKYLRHWMTDDPKKPQYISQQISQAWAKWAEIKHILTDNEVWLWIRVKMLESMIRSRLTYAVQSSKLKAAESKKLDSIWTNFCRKLLKGGYKRKKPPKKKPKKKGRKKKNALAPPVEDEADEDVEWSFCYTNEQVLKICKTAPISEFCQRRHIKYLAHITRMPNSNEQKRWLFTESEHPRTRNQWKELGRELRMDEQQTRRMLFRKEELNAWLRSRETP